MANTTIITQNSRASMVKQFYYTPTAIIPGSETPISKLFLFMASVDEWDNENDPPVPEEDYYAIKQLFKNLIAIKQVTPNNMCPVLPRVDWKPNVIYDAYTDLEPMFITKVPIQGYMAYGSHQIIFDFSGLYSSEEDLARLKYYVPFGLQQHITGPGITNNTVLMEYDFNPDEPSYIFVSNPSTDNSEGNETTLKEFILYTRVRKNFYVKNSMDQVFKCLWNNNGEMTGNEEPIFDVGTYDVNNIVKTPDGYKWKYMYTVNQGLKQKFQDKHWMPVPVGSNVTNPYKSSAGVINTSGCGAIDVINVIDGGFDYSNTSDATIITITGDGTGAAANAVVIDGVVTDVLISNKGKNYTYAEIDISTGSGYSGSGAVLTHSISPIGGHGFDLIEEFGVSDIMVSVEFTGSESDTIPDEFSFRQIGLLLNPYAYDTFPNFANNAIYNTTTKLSVSFGIGLGYSEGEFVYQGESLESSSYSAKVVHFNTSTNLLEVINTTGTPVVGVILRGLTSGTERLLSVETKPNIIPFSGYFSYIENRSGIQRSYDGAENLKLVLKF